MTRPLQVLFACSIFAFTAIAPGQCNTERLKPERTGTVW